MYIANDIVIIETTHIIIPIIAKQLILYFIFLFIIKYLFDSGQVHNISLYFLTNHYVYRSLKLFLYQ